MKKLNTIILSCVIAHSMTFTDTTKDETDLFHNFILANYHQSHGELEKAEKGYQQLLLSSDASPQIYRGYIPLLAASKKYQHIVALIPRLEKDFANDPDIQLIFAQALEQSGRQKEADELYIKLSRQFKTHQEIVYQAVNSYRRNKERDNAIKLIDELLNNSPRKPNNFVFHFMKAQLYTELSDKPHARESVNKTLELYPRFDKGWLLSAMLDEEAGKLDEAIKGYTNFLELTDAPNQQLEKHLLELLIKRRMVESKKKTMAVDNNCFLEGLSLFQKKEYRKGMQSINKCLEKESTNKDATILKINMLGAMRKHRQALKTLRTCLYNDPHDEIWYSQLHALCLNGLSERRALKLLVDVIHEHPEAPLAHLHIAELFKKKGERRLAIFHYQRALESIDDVKTRTQIMYNLACLYEQVENYARMKSLLSLIIEQSPEFLPAKHLLAQHHLEHEYNVTLAQQLLDEIMYQDPNNPHYRITQARLFQLTGAYDDALTTLSEARICAFESTLIDAALLALADEYIKTQLQNPHYV